MITRLSRLAVSIRPATRVRSVRALGLASALACGLCNLWPTSGSAAGTDADIVLKPSSGTTAPAGAGGLTVALFAADTTLSAPVEALKPEQSWPVSTLEVALNANPGLCGDQPIAKILDLPNLGKDEPTGDGPECIFGVLLTIEAGPRKFEVATECGDWVDNTALCWGYGRTGEFRLIRATQKAAVQFRLVFPGPGPKRTPQAKAPAAAGGSRPGDPTTGSDDPASQKHGMFLDTLLDDKKDSKGDLWLVWTSATVDIAYTR